MLPSHKPDVVMNLNVFLPDPLVFILMLTRTSTLLVCIPCLTGTRMRRHITSMAPSRTRLISIPTLRLCLLQQVLYSTSTAYCDPLAKKAIQPSESTPTIFSHCFVCLQSQNFRLFWGRIRNQNWINSSGRYYKTQSLFLTLTMPETKYLRQHHHHHHLH